jgi:hypothetical protein
MVDLLFRTEDLTPDEISDYFVETELDRRVIDALKSRQPVVLVGSRGVGKSFLLKVAARELRTSFDENNILPVYVSFIKSSLLASDDGRKLEAWMLSRISGAIIRAAKKQGLLDKPSRALTSLAGGPPSTSLSETLIERLADSLELGWKGGSEPLDLSIVPSVEAFREAIDDLCEEAGISRIAVFIDEAAHVLNPEQQRVFFTLFRDLRAPKMTLNAAVYPGVTHYGETFQPVHDAEFHSLDRDIWAPGYVASMKEMVEKQADPKLLRILREKGENFSLLAYASSGNPRVLLKTVSKSPSLSASEISSTVREFYRDQVWMEHSQLASVYLGHRELVDWGRSFIEGTVLRALKARNDEALSGPSPKTALSIWIHRDAPKRAVEALRILQYTGILKEHSLGMRATRGEVGTRYVVNVGCVISMESNPAQTGYALVRASDQRRMIEFGANHDVFQALANLTSGVETSSISEALRQRLIQSVRVLDLTDWQKDTLEKHGFTTIKDVLGASDVELQRGYYVGPQRSRQMKNAAETSVLEYLSG